MRSVIAPSHGRAGRLEAPAMPTITSAVIATPTQNQNPDAMLVARIRPMATRRTMDFLTTRLPRVPLRAERRPVPARPRPNRRDAASAVRWEFPDRERRRRPPSMTCDVRVPWSASSPSLPGERGGDFRPLPSLQSRGNCGPDEVGHPIRGEGVDLDSRGVIVRRHELPSAAVNADVTGARTRGAEEHQVARSEVAEADSATDVKLAVRRPRHA